MRLMLAALILAMPQTAPKDALEPWGSNRHPSDASKSHVETVSASRQAYSVKQGGTMDGTNCRTPVSVGMMDGIAIEQVWESNRAVRMENVGETDLVNPWLSNGRNNFRTMDEIIASAVSPGMTDKEKAQAIWFQQIRNRYHLGAGGKGGGDGSESGDPVKVLNVYGHNTCGDDSLCMAGLWKKAGLKAAPCRLVGHCVAQVFYDNAWHVMDGDMHSMYLMRDNETLAGEQDIVRDHDLVKRSHTQGILNPDSRANDEWEAAIYVYEGKVTGDRGCYVSTMGMTLRPGEAITWRWGHLNPMKWRGQAPHLNPNMVCNGLWEYRPDFSKELWRKGAESVEGVRSEGGALRAEPGKAGTIVWVVKSPYVFLGGKLESEGTGAAFSVSIDGKTWEDDLEKLLSTSAKACYEYRVRCRLEGEARLQRFRIVNDVQMAPLALPGMSIGTNEFVYTDETKGTRSVKITHEWVERSATKAPEAPPSAVYPADKGEAKGSAFVFKWAAPKDPDGDKIADYQFELSARPDLKLPLSTNFYRMISRTADRGKAQFTLPAPGLLNPDKPYYWRVRAKDDKGVWGPWSKVWSFTSRGPTPPLELALAVDEKAGTGVLKWKPNPSGRKPAKYRVYGSDEKGFSTSDQPYAVSIGVTKELSPTFSANFIAEVAGTELPVLGGESANRAFYRVIAVDEEGSRSGPSDYVAAPRPFIPSRPAAKAKVGQEWKTTVTALRSIGDYRARNLGGQEIRGFFDIESPRFTLAKGPAWLKIDEKTGVLSGTPDAAGKVDVVVSAVIELPERRLDEPTLAWGNEKIVSSGIQKVGSASQAFALEVER